LLAFLVFGQRERVGCYVTLFGGVGECIVCDCVVGDLGEGIMVVGSYWEVGVGEMKGWDDWVHTYEERVVVEWGPVEEGF
jgi:hypothetical protein